MLTNAVKILEETCECNHDSQLFRDSLNGQYLNLSACLLLLKDYDETEKVLRKMLAEESHPRPNSSG